MRHSREMIAPAESAAGLHSSHICRQPVRPAHRQQAWACPFKRPRLADRQGAANGVETHRPSWAAAFSGTVGDLSVEDSSTAGTQEDSLHASSRSLNGDSQLRTLKSSEGQSSVSEEDLVELGMFGSPHGVKGAIRLFPTTDSADERLRHAGTRWTLPREVGSRKRGHVPRQIEVIEGRPILQKGREVWLLRLEGVDSPEAADMLKGLRLLMHLRDRPALDSEDDFYVQDLVGMQVVMQASGSLVGSVVDVYDGTGTYDVLRVALAPENTSGSEEAEGGEKTVLLPFASEVVPVVDRDSRRMEITPPVGLLDLVTVAKESRAKAKRGR